MLLKSTPTIQIVASYATARPVALAGARIHNFKARSTPGLPAGVLLERPARIGVQPCGAHGLDQAPVVALPNEFVARSLAASAS